MTKSLEILSAEVKLRLASSKDLVRAAEQALVDGSKSQSFALLAGEDYTEPYYADLEKLFIKGLKEDEIPFPNDFEAGLKLLIDTLEKIVDGEISPSKGMSYIDDNLDHLDLYPKENNYVGEKLGLEHCYTWYRELQDYSDGSALFYHTDLPRDEAANKFREHLKEEAAKALKKIKTKKFEQGVSHNAGKPAS